MDLLQISSLTGLAANGISIVVNSYQAFRRSNVEKYFAELNKSNESLKVIGNSEELEGRFYYIIDQVARERNRKKLVAWKNATISLAMEDIDFDESDGHFQTLEHLTYFDLTVLQQIYAYNYNNLNFKVDILDFFQGKGIGKEYILRSLRQLAYNNLIREQYESTAMVSGAKANLQDFHYSKNNLGRDFLNFVFRQDF
ncbi:GNAT superfamily N-acetyltransferase [Virgibacillus natechei]|uniref:GNAT superfamily N-acetyltransferase n=1 Tax=Virgibacillus natechei TaxID=1216297 RepID=A0ABS4IL77_9BACI|nr:hypothetical protein [Virgibacillus natechei]MBP1970764.1 GNAT superfamily N-acetyltransferase [Virgibacillus natechei]UZD12328.1 hypothetical protein OLD84_15615 [Virgibacillus natechei]